MKIMHTIIPKDCIYSELHSINMETKDELPGTAFTHRPYGNGNPGLIHRTDASIEQSFPCCFLPVSLWRSCRRIHVGIDGSARLRG